MKQTRHLMGMPVIVEVVDDGVTAETFDYIYRYFAYVDAKFSTYKEDSEITRINRGLLTVEQSSEDMQMIFALAEQTRQETDGYFDIAHNGLIDPSGIVKGWAIYNAVLLLHERGFRNYYVDAGGDVQVGGKNGHGENWRVGVRNPFAPDQFVKVLSVTDCGVATSGSYLRGSHIYNPKHDSWALDEIVSLTVIAPNIYEADRFATPAFAMGPDGLAFISRIEGFEGYMIDREGCAMLTPGFAGYVVKEASIVP